MNSEYNKVLDDVIYLVAYDYFLLSNHNNYIAFHKSVTTDIVCDNYKRVIKLLDYMVVKLYVFLGFEKTELEKLIINYFLNNNIK